MSDELEDMLLEQSMPVLFEHCQRIYNAMLQQARPAEDDSMVWEGFLTKLITKDLNFSVPFYTSTTQALKRMGCMRQLRRGGAGTPSLWQLIREPDAEAFRNNASKSANVRSKSRITALEQRIRDMQTQINDLTEMVEALMQVKQDKEEK